MSKKTTRLVAFLVILWIGALAWNYFLRASWAFAFTAIVFTMGITAFAGALNISRDMRRRRGTFEDGDVRFAVTCSFVTVFFALLSFYAFTRDEPTPFAKTLIENFLQLTALVVGFYFATSGAIEFLRVREGMRTGRSEPEAAESAPATTKDDDSD